MLALRGVSITFGSRTLFSQLDLAIQARDRIGLVGPNGAGKSTILSLLSGDLEPDTGFVERIGNARIGVLNQEAPCQIDRTVLDEATSGAGPYADVRDALAAITEDLGNAASDDPNLAALIEKRSDIEEEFERLGGERTVAEAKRVLAGLGFVDEDYLRRTQELSGGWRVRLALARLLVTVPDVLLLDEPTNHLDLAALEWLETELSVYRGALVVVSHDRTFLDKATNETVEVEAGTVTPYAGNYSAYVKERERRLRTAEATAKRREQEMAKARQFIQRFRAQTAWASQVKSREKMLSRLEQEAAKDASSAPARRRQVTFRFPPAAHATRIACEMVNVAKHYGERSIIDNLSLVIERSERISLVGPNGSGKSTLLRLLAGIEQPDGGTLTLGPQSLVAYFAQHQADVLNTERTVLEEASADAPSGTPNERVREALGRMLFRSDKMATLVGSLSGGERARLALAKLLLQPANILLLDEPTNHLDIPSKEALEAALTGYDGAIVVASHDRYFLERLNTTKLVEMAVNGQPAVVRLGTYADWRELQARIEETERAARQSELQRQQLEADVQSAARDEITRLQTKRDHIATRLADPGAFKEDGAWGDLLEEYQAVDARLTNLLNRWHAPAPSGRTGELVTAGD